MSNSWLHNLRAMPKKLWILVDLASVQSEYLRWTRTGRNNHKLAKHWKSLKHLKTTSRSSTHRYYIYIYYDILIYLKIYIYVCVCVFAFYPQSLHASKLMLAIPKSTRAPPNILDSKITFFKFLQNVLNTPHRNRTKTACVIQVTASASPTRSVRT